MTLSNPLVDQAECLKKSQVIVSTENVVIG